MSSTPVTTRDLFRLLKGQHRVVAAAIGLTLAGTACGLVQPLLAMRAIDTLGRGGPLTATIVLLIGLFLVQCVGSAPSHWVADTSEQ